MTLSGGPYPDESQLTGGTTLFVDLTEVGELAPYAHLLPDGVRHLRRPIADHGVPSPEEMAEMLDVIDAALAGGETVYVHCWAGIGRTRTVIGCHCQRHRRRPGREPETAEQREFVRSWPAGR